MVLWRMDTVSAGTLVGSALSSTTQEDGNWISLARVSGSQLRPVLPWNHVASGRALVSLFVCWL